MKPFARPRLLRDASWKAVHEAMRANPAVHVFGEGAEVKAFYDAPAMLKEFPGRIHTLPISEDGNLNVACGAALMGTVPVVDMISCDFLYRAMDSIVNTAAKLEGRTIVLRAETILGGPTTGQRPEASLAHVPGLYVAIPSTPRDSYGLMVAALGRAGVTVFIEDRMVQDGEAWSVHDLETVEPLPFGNLAVRFLVKGSNCAILTYGVMRQSIERLLKEQAFNDFYAEPNHRADLYDLRSIYPIDWRYLKEGHIFRRTRNLLIVEPDIVYGGVGAEIAAWVAENMPSVRIKRLGARRETMDAAHPERSLPADQEVLDAIAGF